MLVSVKSNFKYLRYFLVNFITWSRILFVLPLFFFSSFYLYLWIIIWAGISDFLDGFLARYWECTTETGARLDQYADKWVSSIFLYVLYMNRLIPIWFLLLFFLREVLMILFRQLSLAGRSSNIFGKSKTFLLYLLIIGILIKSIYSLNTVYYNITLFLETLILLFGYISLFISLTLPLAFHKKLKIFIGTSFYSSLLFKKMPGTISSFFIFLLLYPFLAVPVYWKLSILLLSLVLHYYAFPLFQKISKKNDDPGIYTWDETIAILFIWVFTYQLSYMWFVSFAVFRFFDILKPLGIRSFELNKKFSALFRNLGDDLIAMLYTSITLFLLQRLINFV